MKVKTIISIITIIMILSFGSYIIIDRMKHSNSKSLYSANEQTQKQRRIVPCIWWMVEFNNCVYAGSETDGLYFSMDKGKSWQKAETPGDSITYLCLNKSSQKLYIGVDSLGFYESSNGSTWKLIFSTKDPNSIISFNNNIIIGYSDTKRFHQSLSTDNGSSWVNKDFNNDYIGYFHVTQSGKLYACSSFYNTLFVSYPPYKKWTDLKLDTNIFSFAGYSDEVYIITDKSITKDDGNNWIELKLPKEFPANNTLINIQYGENGVALFGKSSNLLQKCYLTDKDFSNWKELLSLESSKLNLPENYSVKIIAVFYIQKTYYVSYIYYPKENDNNQEKKYKSGIASSVDEGLTWRYVDLPSDNNSIETVPDKQR